jgi:Tfp pilus assembly protein PilO
MQSKGKASIQKGNRSKASSTCLKLFVVVVVVITVALVQLSYHNSQKDNVQQTQNELTFINEKIKEAYRKNHLLVASLTNSHTESDTGEASKDIVLALPEGGVIRRA